MQVEVRKYRKADGYATRYWSVMVNGNCSPSPFTARVPWPSPGPSPTPTQIPMSQPFKILPTPVPRPTSPPLAWRPTEPDDLCGPAATVARRLVAKAHKLHDDPAVPVKILLYGPPGVGKTSIADMVADALSGTRSIPDRGCCKTFGNGNPIGKILVLARCCKAILLF
jgi:hypothetical protein